LENGQENIHTKGGNENKTVYITQPNLMEKWLRAIFTITKEIQQNESVPASSEK